MNKKLAVCSMVLLVPFGALCGGCGKSASQTSQQWTPAKVGMSHQQFFKMANEKMKERQTAAKAPGGDASQPGTPGSRAQ